jgi:hypothetical protein
MQAFLLAIGSVHMLGVLAEPLRFFSRSDVAVAPDFELIAETMQTYSQWLYLDHGYFFFAPNPGPGRLIQCSFQPERMASDLPASPDLQIHADVSDVSTLPDKQNQRPRLLYHRYLMLAEFYNSRFAPSQISSESRKDPEFAARWAQDSDMYKRLQASMTKSLKHKLGTSSITLSRVERSLPTPYMVLNEKVQLNDPRLLDVLPESFLDPTVQELPAEKPKEPDAKPR